MSSGNRNNPLLDDFKRELEANAHLSLDEQLRGCDDFLRFLEEQAYANDGLRYGELSETSVLRKLEASFNHYPRAVAKEMFIGKFVSGIDAGDNFIGCLRLLLNKFPSSSRVSSLMGRMAANNQHLRMLKKSVENY